MQQTQYTHLNAEHLVKRCQLSIQLPFSWTPCQKYRQWPKHRRSCGAWWPYPCHLAALHPLTSWKMPDCLSSSCSKNISCTLLKFVLQSLHEPPSCSAPHPCVYTKNNAARFAFGYPASQGSPFNWYHGIIVGLFVKPTIDRFR